MSLFSKLFGGGKSADPTPEPELYEGFAMTPAPQKSDAGYRIGAIIEKDGKRHDLIRADVIADLETANAASIAKARQTIHQLGARLFDM
jgi:hypothetical protein